MSPDLIDPSILLTRSSNIRVPPAFDPDILWLDEIFLTQRVKLKKMGFLFFRGKYSRFWGGWPNLGKKNLTHTHQISDGSRVKNFWPGSGRVKFCCSGWIRSAIFGFGMALENFPLKSQIFQFFAPSGHKKSCWVKKYLGQSWDGLLFTEGQKYAWAWSGQGSSLHQMQWPLLGHRSSNLSNHRKPKFLCDTCSDKIFIFSAILWTLVVGFESSKLFSNEPL